jgi:predicted transcriptional regulator YdeE
MTPRLVMYGGATVVGIDVRTSNAAEAEPGKGKIGALWGRFHGEDVLGKIPGKKLPVIPMGVYTDYAGDASGEYRLMAGTAVEAGTTPPAGMATAIVPAGRYLMFEAEGPMPNVVGETWQAVWSHFSSASAETRAYTVDFELYPGPTSVQIHISVK